MKIWARFLFMKCSPHLYIYAIEMHGYFLWIFTCRGVVGLAKIVVDGTCLFKRKPIYFPFSSLWLILVSELTSCLSVYRHVLFTPLCACLSHIYLDLFLHLWPAPPLLQVNSPVVFTKCSFLLSFCPFFFFPFLDLVLPVPPQLLRVSRSVYKLQIPYPFLSGHSCKIFPVSCYFLSMCI